MIQKMDGWQHALTSGCQRDAQPVNVCIMQTFDSTEVVHEVYSLPRSACLAVRTGHKQDITVPSMMQYEYAVHYAASVTHHVMCIQV